LALAQTVRPYHLAGPAIERDDRAPRAAGRVQHALDRERRPFELVLRTRTEVVGLVAPRDFELVEVRAVDLIERRVARSSEIRRVVRPVAGSRGGLRRRLRLRGDDRVERDEGEENASDLR